MKIPALHPNCWVLEISAAFQKRTRNDDGYERELLFKAFMQKQGPRSSPHDHQAKCEWLSAFCTLRRNSSPTMQGFHLDGYSDTWELPRQTKEWKLRLGQSLAPRSSGWPNLSIVSSCRESQRVEDRLRMTMWTVPQFVPKTLPLEDTRI